MCRCAGTHLISISLSLSDSQGQRDSKAPSRKRQWQGWKSQVEIVLAVHCKWDRVGDMSPAMSNICWKTWHLPSEKVTESWVSPACSKKNWTYETQGMWPVLQEKTRLWKLNMRWARCGNELTGTLKHLLSIRFRTYGKTSHKERSDMRMWKLSGEGNSREEWSGIVRTDVGMIPKLQSSLNRCGSDWRWHNHLQGTSTSVSGTDPSGHLQDRY